MEELFDSFLEAVKRYDLEGSFSILDDVLASGSTQIFSKELEKLTEDKNALLPYQLRIRDHIYEFLDCHPFYFSLFLPAYALLDKIAGISNQNQAKAHVTDLVRNMMEAEDPTLDLSFVEVDQLMNSSRYIVILPSVLDFRNNEMQSCKIQYSTVVDRRIIRYCISELQQTYFGRKVIAALNLDLKNPTIGEKDFNSLEKALIKLNYDVEEMLEKIPEAEWSQFVSKHAKANTERYTKSLELKLLYDASLARIALGTDTWEAKWQAMEIIDESKTKFCNDAVGLAAFDKDTMIRMPAIQLLERTRDISQIPLLSEVLRDVISDPDVDGGVKASVSKAISVLSSSQFSSSIKKDYPPPIDPDPKMLDYIRNHMIPRVADMLKVSSESRDFSVERQEFIMGLLLEGMGPQFEKLMNDPNRDFRRSLVEIAAYLPKEDATGVISKGLRDKDRGIVARATEILESRWADEIW